MARRFSFQDKYFEKVFVKLSKNSKLVYYYLYETADIAGFNDLLSSKLCQCTDLTEEEINNAVEELREKNFLLLSEDRASICFMNYLKEQGNLPLNYQNSSHKGVCKSIKRELYDFRKSAKNFAVIPILKEKELLTLGEMFSGDFAPYLT